MAQISQRTAMRALADAVSEEGRSESLAVRSRDLVRHYSPAERSGDAQMLAQTLAQAGAFTAALAALASDAEKSRADAAQQAQWQADALGKAQVKANRHEERLTKARTELEASKARRDLDPAAAPNAERRIGTHSA
ncbi:MAG: hypothetical protein WBA51_13520 [Erythrobacter sp.]